MYAFGPLPKFKQSGRVIGTHQKIDRVARRQLVQLLPDVSFPDIKSILHFEGSRGPDGIKLKSPGRDEPWHFIDPATFGDNDQLLKVIDDHIFNLAEALKENNDARASFEAAWLAHAVTDGLTPAHHDPLDDQVRDLRVTDDRKYSIRSRVVMTGSGSRRKFVENNWRYWGAKGVMTTHTLFEAGVATTVKPLRFSDSLVTPQQLEQLKSRGFASLYSDMIRAVDALGMYDEFKQYGWTRKLARQTKDDLLPTIICAVTLAWYDAVQRSKESAK